MALTTYAELKSAVADWLERGDLAPRIPDFIRLAESRLNRRLRLRLMEAEAGLTGAAGQRLLPLPAGFSEALGLWLEGPSGRTPLRFVGPADLAVSSVRGQPAAWTVDQDQAALDRPLDRAGVFTLRMLADLALSDAAPVNAVLTRYPDLYLFGALVEAAPYLRDADLLALFSARLESALAEAGAKEARSRALATLGAEAPLRWGGPRC